MIWSTRHKFKVGDRVRHVATGQIRTIFALDQTVDESYKLNEKVDGFYHWSTFDLELVEENTNETSRDRKSTGFIAASRPKTSGKW